MHSKCFVVLNTSTNSQVVSEFVNPSQRQFLMHQLKSVINNLTKRSMNAVSEYETSNGIWYYKYGNTVNNVNFKQLLFVELLSKEVDYRSATLLLNQLITVYTKNEGKDTEGQRKLKNSISETLKVFNANKPSNIKALNNNVAELQDMMRGNVNKIIQNTTDLEDVQKKSERLSQMSLTFQSSARDLQRKLARKQWITRIIVGVLIAIVIGIIIFVIL